MQYTAEDCLLAIEQVAADLGKSPSVTEYREHCPDELPSAASISRIIGSWNSAKKEANLAQYPITYTEADCIEAIQDVAERLGKSPTYNEYQNTRPDSAPSIRQIEIKAGGFNAAKQTANLDTTLPDDEKYERSDFINALREVAEMLDKSPSISEYEEHRPDCAPAINSFANEFGGYNEAKRQTNLDVLWTQYTDEGCIEHLQSVDGTLDEPLTLYLYEKHRDSLSPASSTICNKFGSWNSAKKAAGIDTFVYTERECLDAIQTVAEVLDGPPTSTQYNEHRAEEEPCLATILNKFGVWDLALHQAGLDEPSKYSDEECIKALQKVAEKLDTSPSQTEYANYKPDWAPAKKTIQTYFGGWNAAKSAAGLDVIHDIDEPSFRRYGSDWNEVREEILRRDDRKCTRCGISETENEMKYGKGLDIHHIYKLRLFIRDIEHIIDSAGSLSNLSDKDYEVVEKKLSNANHRSNLATLCAKCHPYVERMSVDEQITELDMNQPKVCPNI